MAPVAREFVVGFKDFVQCNGVDLVTFKSDEHKDDRAQAYLQNWQGGEGVLFVGKTQKKAHVLYSVCDKTLVFGRGALFDEFAVPWRVGNPH